MKEKRVNKGRRLGGGGTGRRAEASKQRPRCGVRGQGKRAGWDGYKTHNKRRQNYNEIKMAEEGKTSKRHTTAACENVQRDRHTQTHTCTQQSEGPCDPTLSRERRTEQESKRRKPSKHDDLIVVAKRDEGPSQRDKRGKGKQEANPRNNEKPAGACDNTLSGRRRRSGNTDPGIGARSQVRAETKTATRQKTRHTKKTDKNESKEKRRGRGRQNTHCGGRPATLNGYTAKADEEGSSQGVQDGEEMPGVCGAQATMTRQGYQPRTDQKRKQRNLHAPAHSQAKIQRWSNAG